MTWSHQATKMLNFVKRTLYQCTCDAKVKATAYSTLVRPTLEYATAVWDPYQQYLINSIEMVQRRAARWVKQEYSITTSVTAILNNLKWNLLPKHQQYSRLTLFFQVFMPRFTCYQYIICPPHALTHYMWHTHHIHYIPPSTPITYFQKSFFPRTITSTDWNSLPDNIIKRHFGSFHPFLEII